MSKYADMPLDQDETKTPQPTLADDVVEEVQHAVRQKDPYPMEETTTRNVIMLGRSGSGKTTAINVIKDICAQPQKRSLFSDTVGARFQSFSLDNTKEKRKYTINIIDTPGVAEVKPMGENTRSDSTILETIKFCLKNEITRVHSLLIFAAFGERVDAIDRAAFKIYLEMFDNPNVNIAFCITKCEDLTTQECEDILADLKREAFFATVLEKPNVTVFYTGCVNQSLIRNTSDDMKLFRLYAGIHTKREKLVNFIFHGHGHDRSEEELNEGVMLFDLPIINSSLASVRDIFGLLDDKIRQLAGITDFSTGGNQMLIKEFNDNLDYLKANDGLFANNEMYQLFVDLKRKLLKLRPRITKIDESAWTQLTSSIIF